MEPRECKLFIEQAVDLRFKIEYARLGKAANADSGCGDSPDHL